MTDDSADDGTYDDFDDTATPSYRMEQGKPPSPTPRERMRDVPITFGSDGSAGIVGRGPEPEDDERQHPDPEAAESQRAVEEGARWLESYKGE